MRDETISTCRGAIISGICTLDLSKSRANDAALDILRACKLTGNFHANLEIVIRDIGAFDKVTHQIEPNPKLPYWPDCRHVVFKPNENTPADMFGEIIKSLEAQIGFEAPWRVKPLHGLVSKQRDVHSLV